MLPGSNIDFPVDAHSGFVRRHSHEMVHTMNWGLVEFAGRGGSADIFCRSLIGQWLCDLDPHFRLRALPAATVPGANQSRIMHRI